MSDDIPSKYVEVFGETTAKEFLLLQDDLSILRFQWRIYRGLFGTNPERVELLNSVSGSFAQTIEQVLFESVLLRLRRFIDTGSTRRSSYPLSIQLLRKIAKDEGSKELHALITECVLKCGFAKNWADKRIAHSDYEYRMGRFELEKASRAKVTEAIDAIAAVIKWIGSEMLDTHYVTHPFGSLKDENFVLKLLYEGKRVWDAKPELAQSLLQEGRHAEYDAVYSYPDWLQKPEDEWD